MPNPIPNVSRRVVLKALSTSVALPWLESAHGEESARGSGLAPNEAIASNDPNAPAKRFAFLFFGDGIHPPQWWSKGTGSSLELGPAFASLETIKSKVNFIHGLHHPEDVVGGHAKGAAGILTGIRPQGGRDVQAAISLDQLLAQKFGDATPLPSLVLACERPVSGFHESSFSMMYASHVSWSSPVSPVPSEIYPALAFDSLFESKGNKTHASVLDYVNDQLGDVSRKVSAADRSKIDEYATSVREVEQRLAKLSQARADGDDTSTRDRAQRPADGVPNRLDEHARLMCDVIALAFQTDRTRVATLLLTNNLSGQVYPFLGLKVDHHNYSHNWQGEEYAKITRFWVEQYAYLLHKLDGMQEGDGSVLDHSCIMLANEQWTAHSAPKIPLLMAGGLGGALPTGRSLDYEQAKERRMSSLYLSLLDRMGLHLNEFGNSDQQLPEV
jgi:hypothetical protein